MPAVFACHMTEGAERACAGMLRVCGFKNNRVRMALLRGALPNVLQVTKEGGIVRSTDPDPMPELYGSYAELAKANGVEPK